MTVVCAHQINFLPGCSVMAKVQAADAVIWLDKVAYTAGGFINRNQLPDGTWLTVPVDHGTLSGTLGMVAISQHGNWRKKIATTLTQRYGSAPHFDPEIPNIIETETTNRLVTLNHKLLQQIMADLGIEVEQHFQSELPCRGEISYKLASMVKQVGGTVYLSGPSGRGYLNPEPFEKNGIELRYFEWLHANPSIVDPLFRFGAIREQVTA